MDQTLEELRAENARLEQDKANASQAQQSQPEPAARQEDDDVQAANPDDQTDDGAVEAESWMQSDDQASQDAGKTPKFTDSDIGAAKQKLRAKLEREHQSETEKLRARIAELEQAKSAPVVQVGEKPRREQFYEMDDPDEAYSEAMVEWKLATMRAEHQKTSQQVDQERRALERMQSVTQSVDQHYGRAAKLAEASGIAPEVYQSADLRVRQAVDQVFPGGGDGIVDSLIANIGEGSEKVFYNLGVNNKRLSELERLLREDPTGLRASVYLGRLSAELSAPAKRTSNAPAPAAQAQGDANTTASGAALQRQYKDAGGDVEKRISIKRKAKAAGVDTSSW